MKQIDLDIVPKVSRTSDLSHVEVDYKCKFEDMDRQLYKDIRFLSGMYGFLVEKNTTLTFNEFADLIARNYDQTNPRNAFVTSQLRTHHANIMNNQPCVIYHPENGVFLGDFIGLGIWSKLDPAGADAAPTFPNKQAAEEYMKSWATKPEGILFAPVKPGADGYANLQACTDAGLPGWEPTDCTDNTRERERQSA